MKTFLKGMLEKLRAGVESLPVKWLGPTMVVTVILVVVIILLNAAMTTDNSSEPGTGTTVVEITHPFGLFSSGIKFSCSSATIDYASREVTMSDVCQIGSVGGSGWTVSFSMRGDKVVVNLDSDEKYNVTIGKIKCTME